MSDVTVNPDVTPAASPTAEKPDVDELFAAPDVDELFPADRKPVQPTSFSSKIHDYIFSQANAHARILDAFGHGFAQDWGAAEMEHQEAYHEADEWMRKSGMWNDYKAGQSSIIKAANEVIMRPAVSALTSLLPLAKSVMGGALHGAEQATEQTGEEYGFPGLAHEISAIPEAFPEGPGQFAGIPHVPELPPVIAEAKSLDTIGAGEAGYFGTKPVEPTTPAESAPAAKAENREAPEATQAAPATATTPPTVAAPEAAASPAEQAPPDIHAVARQIAPQTFQEFDALAQKKDTFRRWIAELRDVRDQTAAENAPHADAIADLNTQIEAQQAKKGGYGKLQSLIEKRDALMDERDAYIAEHTQGDSADMAKIRQQLMQTDYRMRDLAGDVSAAYRQAAERMPVAETVEPETPAASEQRREETPVESAAAAPQPVGESAPIGGEETPAPAQAPQAEVKPAPVAAKPASTSAAEPATTAAEAARLQIAHAPSIVADVAQKLKAAGRPAEEADAAAQIVAAYWETRAQRFEGRKGTATEMYARAAPEIVAGNASAGIGEQTIAVHTPNRALPLSGLPAQTTSVGDLVDVFDKQSAASYPLFQGVNGRIRIRENARNTITLMKRADASTFIHETGHDWLDRMLDDAVDPEAPQVLRDDANTVLKWLGVDSPDAVKTRHHEKFARGFETYMMEGRAPSQGLARVFAKFKTWLTTIYKTVAALKAPISDDIRAVFDRMLAEKPEKTVIAPEIDRTKGRLAETHENLAETTPPARAHEVANTIEAERDSQAARNLIDQGDNDTRLRDTGAEAEGRAAGGAQPSGHADEAGAVGFEAGAPVGPGAERGRGGEAQAEGAQPRKEQERLNKAPTPLINFIASQGGIKGSDALISDLRQGLGAKNHYVPGFGQLIRVPKQLSAAAKKAGRLESMSLDRAREAAIEKGLLPEGASIRDLIDAIEKEVRGEGLNIEGRPEDEAERSHAEHNFVETINDALKAHGGTELTDAERARVLELRKNEGLHDPAEIIERLALESDDEDVAGGAPPHAEGIPGWDIPAPGWELSDDGRGASIESGTAQGAQSFEPGSAVARGGGEAAREGASVDPNADLPKSETQLVDKAGNIRLDNLGTPEDVNAVIRATAEDLAPFEQAITRGHIPDREVIKLAEALGMSADKLNQRRLGEAFNAEQIIAARKLLIQSAEKVRDLASKAAGGSDADVIAYAEAADRHRMIQEQVSGITAEAGRALRAFRDLGGAKEAKEIAAIVMEGTGRTLYQLRKNAARIANMETSAKVSKFVHESARPGLFDWIQSVFINALISGPLTHAGYTAAGEMFALFRAVGETAASALVGKVREIAGIGPEDYAKAAEVPHQLYGMYRGARTGIKASWQAWKANRIVLPAEVERQPSLPGITGQSVGSHQTIPNPEIGGITIPIGTVLESPGRLVAALHSFNWTTFYSQSIAGQAFRQAMAEKLEGHAFSRRVAELTQSPTDAMIKTASEDAQGGALMQKPAYGSFTGQISRITNTGIKLPNVPLPGGTTLPLGTLRPLKFIDPFVQIQANVQKTAFGRGTPLALFKQSVRDDLSMKNGGVAFDLAAGKILAGTTFMMAAGGLAAEGLLNNSGPSDPKQARAWQKVYGLPHGLRIGDMSFDALRLGNLGLQMSVAADLYHVAHMITSEDATNLAGEVLHAFTQNIIDESSMRGPAEILRAVEDHDRYGPAWVRNFASSMVPFSVGLGQVARQIDPYSRNARTLMDAIKAKIPFESETLTPRRDIWGEPIPNRGWMGTYYERVGKDPVDNALYQLHIYPALPERRIRGVQLTDQQYDDYARISGRTMKMMLNAFVNMPGFATMPDAFKIQQIDKIVKKARGDARTMVLMQYAPTADDIISKANEAKRVKRGMQPATVH